MTLKKFACDLEFISRIERDGKSVTPVDEKTLKTLKYQNEEFEVRCLSMSEETFIASNFNSYIVKIIKTEHQEKLLQAPIVRITPLDNDKGIMISSSQPIVVDRGDYTKEILASVNVTCPPKI